MVILLTQRTVKYTISNETVKIIHNLLQRNVLQTQYPSFCRDVSTLTITNNDKKQELRVFVVNIVVNFVDEVDDNVDDEVGLRALTRV